MKKTNFRVVVHPKAWAQPAEEVCEKIRADIRRHVDNVALVEIAFDMEDESCETAPDRS